MRGALAFPPTQVHVEACEAACPGAPWAGRKAAATDSGSEPRIRVPVPRAPHDGAVTHGNAETSWLLQSFEILISFTKGF